MKKEKLTKALKSFWEIIRFAVIAFLIVIPIRLFVAQPFVVSGSSMVPTFQDGQYLIVDEISYRLGEPKRDDVIIFRNPKNQKVFFIKRIIGLPNETVDLVDRDVIITNKEHPNGFTLDQPFIKSVASNNMHFELGDDEYFVMGDNRGASSDSRYWGPVPRKLIVGKAFLRLLPVNQISFMPGAYRQAE